MKILFLFLVIILLGCGTLGKQLKPVARGPERLYSSNCSVCHRLYSPKVYSYEKLEKYVRKYGKGLSVEERQQLLGYLKENSKDKV